MSLRAAIDPSDLSQQKASLDHVPISTVEPTATGGIHLGAGTEHLQKEQQLHDEKLQSQAAGSAQSYCDWAQWQVVPDLVQMNAPTLMSVKYRGKETILGSILLKKDTQQQPELDWAPAQKMAISGVPQLYTVICCDPDAPSRANPKWRNYLHWAVVNAPGPYAIEQGATLAQYQGPAPPPNTGLHRYCFLVYAQTGVVEAKTISVYTDEQRPGWSLDGFLATHQYVIDGSIPIAGIMFRCQNEHQAAQNAEPAMPDQTPLTKREAEQAEKKDMDEALKDAGKK